MLGLALGGLASLGSSLYGGKKARRTMREGVNNANAIIDDRSNAAQGWQEQQFARAGETLAPWQQMGVGARENILAGPDAYQESPYYNFLLKKAMDSVQNSAAGQGTLYSGNTLEGIAAESAGLASQDYDNWWSKERDIMGVGAGADQAYLDAGSQMTNNINNNLMTSGLAQGQNIMTGAGANAGNYMDVASGVNNAIQGTVGNYMYGKGKGWWGGSDAGQPQYDFQGRPIDYGTGGGSSGFMPGEMDLAMGGNALGNIQMPPGYKPSPWGGPPNPQNPWELT